MTVRHLTITVVVLVLALLAGPREIAQAGVIVMGGGEEVRCTAEALGTPEPVEDRDILAAAPASTGQMAPVGASGTTVSGAAPAGLLAVGVEVPGQTLTASAFRDREVTLPSDGPVVDLFRPPRNR